MYDAKTLLQARIENIVETFQKSKDKLLNTLQTTYKQELMPDHQPAWWDPYKDRHRKKVEMAKILQSVMKKDLVSLMHVQKFITLFEKQLKHETTIDPKGHRYRRILNSQNYPLEVIHHQILDVQDIMHKELRAKIKIIRHFMALENELYAESLLQLTKVDTKSLRTSIDYHLHQITDAENELTQAYMKANNGAMLDGAEVTKELRTRLDSLETQVVHECISQHVDEQSISERKYTQRCAYLKQQLFQLQKELLALQIYDAHCNMDELDTYSAMQKLNIFVCQHLLHDFNETIRMDAKRLFWLAFIKSREDFSSYLTGTTRKDQKETWCKACYSETITREDNNKGIYGDIVDPLNLDYLNRNLKMIELEGCNDIDDVKQQIDDIYKTYSTIYLNENSVGITQEYRISVYKEWKKNLSTNLEELKTALESAHVMINSPGSNELQNDNSAQLSELVNFVAKQVELAGARIEGEQNSRVVTSFSESPLGFFAKPVANVNNNNEQNIEELSPAVSPSCCIV